MLKTAKITSVLVATDFSGDASLAANRAALLADKHDASLRVLTVVRENLLTDLRRYLGNQGDAPNRILAGAKLDLEALAARLRPGGNKTDCIVRTGDVETEILAAADHSDILMLGAYGLNPTKDLLIGTTAERLLRKARRPMIVVRKEPLSAYQRVFIAVDFTIHSIAALEFAATIAPDAHLHVFHAVDFDYEIKLRQANVSEETMRELQSQHNKQALANMQNMVEKAGVPTDRVSSGVVAGNPREVTHTAAAAWEADLIVLAKHGRSTVGEFFLGGVTRHTLLRAACDVAVVPDYPRV